MESPHRSTETANQAGIEACDNKSVGVIIRNKMGEIALLHRAKFPIAMAPPAGHEHPHGSPEQAAIMEVEEELGLSISLEGLRRTAIVNRRVNNQCRRPGGNHHSWWVFETTDYHGTMKPSADETKGAGWYSQRKLDYLAERTRQFEAGRVSSEAWRKEPGLEAIWLGFFAELGYVS